MDPNLAAALSRDLVAWVFISAALDKSLHLKAFGVGLQETYRLPAAIARLFAPLVCGAELAVGVALLLGFARPLTEAIAAGLLVALSVAVFAARRTAVDGCACGGLADFGGGRTTHLRINALLVVLIVLGALIDSSWAVVPGSSVSATVTPAAILAAVVALWCLLVVRMSIALVTLTRRWREIEEWRAS